MRYGGYFCDYLGDYPFQRDEPAFERLELNQLVGWFPEWEHHVPNMGMQYSQSGNIISCISTRGIRQFPNDAFICMKPL